MGLWIALSSFLAVTNLQDAGCQAAAERLPLVVYVARTDCTFCRRLERDVLQPLIAAGLIEGNATYVQLLLDSDAAVVDFDGSVSSAQDIAAAHNATLTPTLLFLDGAGNELAPALVGYNGSDFYGSYFERRLRAARHEVSVADCGARSHP